MSEADFVLNRTYAEQQPGRVVIGEFAGKYALPQAWGAGWRAEYFDDRGGLFSRASACDRGRRTIMTMDVGLVRAVGGRFVRLTPNALGHACSRPR